MDQLETHSNQSFKEEEQHGSISSNFGLISITSSSSPELNSISLFFFFLN
jgi:hypothetical protein